MAENLKKKFNFSDQKSLKFFVANGYVIFKNVHNKKIINESSKYFIKCFNKLMKVHKKKQIDFDTNGWANSIIELFSQSKLYEDLINNKKIIYILEKILGTDVCLLGYDALWINVPKDTDPVLLKGQHVDAWTGTSVNTIFAKTFFMNVDNYNGMSVSPGSHLQGLIPVRNRSIDENQNIKFKNLNLNNIKAGDFLIWHPLLVHATTGHSNKNIRISITSRYTSTETEFSSQEKALGYRVLRVGPLNQIKRLIGNDNLAPLRTYGGHPGIDRRLQDIYTHGNYKKKTNYKKYL